VSTLGLAVNLFGMFAMGGHHHHVCTIGFLDKMAHCLHRVDTPIAIRTIRTRIRMTIHTIRMTIRAIRMIIHTIRTTIHILTLLTPQITNRPFPPENVPRFAQVKS
jgi:hypothetical protein